MAAALSSDPVDAFLGADPTSKARPGDDASVDTFLKFDHAAPAVPAAAPPPAQSGEQFGPADPRAQEGPFAALINQFTGANPNYRYGSIAPLATNAQTGTLSLALPNVIFDTLDAFHRGANAGLSADPMDALTVASAAIPGSIGRGPLGEAIRPGVQDAIARGEASNALASRAAPPQLAAPTEAPMAALPASGRLAEAASPSNVVPLPAGNRLAQAAGEPSAANAAAVETPTEAPRTKVLPVRTATQADAEADRILQHFAGNGSTEINTSSAIPGSQPTLSRAIVGGNPGIAALERRISETPPYQNDFVARDTANQAARADHFQQIAGTPANLAAAEAERDAAFKAAEPKVFGPDNAKPTDPTPVVAKIDEILASREGQRDVVAAALQKVRDKIVGKNGETLIDPDQLYGVRKAINDSISPKAAGTASDARQAARQLMSVRDVLDSTIEKGAPGFQKLIADYEKASGPINGMQYLQNMRLTDVQGRMQLGRLNTAIDGLERQQSAPGARLADGVTDEQLNALRELRDDFRRDNGRHIGSPMNSATAQNLGTNSILSIMSHPLMAPLAPLLAHAVAGPAAAIAGAIARHGVVRIGDRGQAMVMEALRRKLLNPEDARSAFRTGR